jgi:hypothetical protein
VSNSDLGSSQLEYMSTVQSPRTPLLIVNDVLDFQSESGKWELNEEGGLFELIEQVIDLFKYAALQKI